MRLNCLMLTLSLELASSVFSGLLRASYCAFERFLYLFSHFQTFCNDVYRFLWLLCQKFMLEVGNATWVGVSHRGECPGISQCPESGHCDL